MSDFNLDGLAEQLSADSEVQTPSPSVETSTPVAETSAPAETTLPTTDTTVDDVIEVTFPDGTKEPIKRSELPNYVLRQRDYTKKSQQIADIRKKYEQLEQNAPAIRQRLEFAQMMEQTLQNPAQLFELAVQRMGPENAVKYFMQKVGQVPQAYDPNDIPTYKEAEELMAHKLSAYEQRMQQMEQEFNDKLEQRLSQKTLEDKSVAERDMYKAKFDNLISEQLANNEVLTAVDNIDDIIRFKALTKIRAYTSEHGYEPSFEQAAQWIQGAVKEQLTKLESKFGAIKAASPLNNGIEPSGGNRPVSVNTERKSYYNTKTGQGDWDNLLTDLAKQFDGVGRL
jgi:hypothetical protein